MNFDDLERELQDSELVSLSTDDGVINGRMNLSRLNTHIEMMSDFFGMAKGWKEHGLFDLKLTGVHGLSIHAYDCSITSQTRSTHNTVERIFPRLLIFDRNKNDNDPDRIHRIKFSFTHQLDYFHYGYIEVFHSVSHAGRKALQEFRKTIEKESRITDFNAPHIAILAHLPRKVIEFKEGGASYRVSSVLRDSSGVLASEVNSDVRFELVFDEPVSISHAIEKVLVWVRFFDQISIRSHAVTSLAISSKRHHRNYYSDCYVPLFAHRAHKERLEDFFSSASSPYRGWRERKSFAETMEDWIAREGEHAPLRKTVSECLEKSDFAGDLTSLTVLCGAIESDINFATDRVIPKEKLAEAAESAYSTLKDVEVTLERIRGLLGYLNNPSLASKISYMFSVVNEGSLIEGEREFIHTLRELRQVSAHGRSVADSHLRYQRVVARTLLSLIALFDLSKSMPVMKCAYPRFEFRRGCQSLKSLGR